MTKIRHVSCLLLSVLGCAGGSLPSPRHAEAVAAPEVEWQPWAADSFARAQREGRHLLVSVQASWCHWCHVMNDSTFGDRRVRAALHEGYVAIKVDSDARPDLAERFRDYAWPATVLLSPDGEVLVALRGYRPADDFVELLRAARAGTIEAEDFESAPEEPADHAQLRRAATESLDGMFDERAGGWGRRQKYPYFAPLEHALFRGDATWTRRALLTAEGTAQLIDPVFGGVYQYSLRGRWDAPHFEKIAAVQADALSAFALAAMHTEQERWQVAMGDVVRYLREFFMSERGAFFTSQDADLNHEVSGTEYYALGQAQRRALGYPRVDQATYTDLNARLIHALLLAARAGQPEAAAMAAQAATAIESLRAGDGGFHHGGAESAGGLRHLRDHAHMLRAELALYDQSGDPAWRDNAVRTADFVLEHLRAERGFYAHTEDPAGVGAFARRRTPLVENGVLARGLTELYRRTGDAKYDEAALHALSVGSEARIQSAGRRVGEFLLALEERAAPYVLVSVVGPAEGEGADGTRALFDRARAWTHPMRLVELGRPGASRYPYPGQPAAYLCNAHACSRPVVDPDGLESAALEFLRAEDTP